MIENAGMRFAQNATNRMQALALLPALPEFRALRRAKPNTMILSPHAHRSTTSLQGTCCDDQLRSPRLTAIAACSVECPVSGVIREVHGFWRGCCVLGFGLYGEWLREDRVSTA